jgi:N-acetylglucosaminyldiphosphoundecaprenol N-acetyl-beta-D-mannosaminyltransferase
VEKLKTHSPSLLILETTKLTPKTKKKPQILSVPSKTYRSDTKNKKVTILNVDIDNISKLDFLEQLDYGVVFTPNVDHLVKLQRNDAFLSAYAMADYKICDSTILMYASQFLGTPIQEKISGSDLLPDFCAYHQRNSAMKLFLLGGIDGVAQKAQYRINDQFERDMVVAAHSPSYGFEKDEAECLEIVARINRSDATVLVVGVGAPKQELWISRYKGQLPNIKIFLAVGAAIDFAAGNKSRSPQWMSEMGLEWLYRLVSEPRRLWKRYLIDDVPFIWLILMQKLKGYKKRPKSVSADARFSLKRRKSL